MVIENTLIVRKTTTGLYSACKFVVDLESLPSAFLPVVVTEAVLAYVTQMPVAPSLFFQCCHDRGRGGEGYQNVSVTETAQRCNMEETV